MLNSRVIQLPKKLHIIKSSLLAQTAVFLALLSPVPGVFAADPGEHMKAGQQLFQTQMYKAAISEFEQATQEQPNDPTAHYYLAVSHVHAGNVAKAYPHFQQAIGLSPANSQIHQMASSALNAYQGGSTSSASSTTASSQSPSAAYAPYSSPATNSGPLLPTKSFNGGASAELDKNVSTGMNQSSYTPNRNYSSSSFSPPQNLYPQGYNHIPGYQSSQTSWGIHNNNAWGSGANRSHHSGWVSSNGSSGGGYSASVNQPSFAINNSAAAPPITRDMTAADQALAMIKRQSDRQVQLAGFGAHMEYYDANTRQQINQINQNANAQINQLLTPTYHYGRRGGYYSSASQSQIDSINNQAKYNIANLRRETDRAESVRQQQQATTEAASNLSDQIRNQRLTGSGVMLRAEGTNLNVRNYETFHSDQDDRDAILPMVARPLTLKEAEKTLPVLPLTVPTKHVEIDQ